MPIRQRTPPVEFFKAMHPALNIIIKAARRASQIINRASHDLDHLKVTTKRQSDFVTEVDKAAEAAIIEVLREAYPDYGILAEESGHAAGEGAGCEYQWIIDPLDGTTNYIHGIFPSSVSIALVEKNIPVVGVVYEMGLNEMFTAWKGGPALLNGQPIHTGTASKPEDALIGTGFPYYDFERLENYIDVLRHLMRTTRGLRRMGSAAVDLCYVAAGRFDGFFEHALHAWDVAAGALIVRQAGGIVTDFNGDDNWLFGGEIIAASTPFYPEFYGVVNRHLGKR